MLIPAPVLVWPGAVLSAGLLIYAEPAHNGFPHEAFAHIRQRLFHGCGVDAAARYGLPGDLVGPCGQLLTLTHARLDRVLQRRDFGLQLLLHALKPLQFSDLVFRVVSSFSVWAGGPCLAIASALIGSAHRYGPDQISGASSCAPCLAGSRFADCLRRSVAMTALPQDTGLFLSGDLSPGNLAPLT